MENAQAQSNQWTPSVIGLNLSKLKGVEEELRTSNLRFQLAAKATSDVIWDWDLVKNDMNRGANYVSVFGHSENGLNAFWESVIHEDDLERVRSEITEVLENADRVYWESWYKHKRPDGKVLHVHDKAYVLRDEKGKALRMTGAMRDITEMKLREAEREKMAKDLLEKNKNLEQFTYIVSHNLRAPLANIIGLTQLVEHCKVSGEVEELDDLLEGLCVSARKLDQIIRDLDAILAMGSETGRSSETVNLKELVDDLRIDLKSPLSISNAEVYTNFEDVESVTSIRGYLYSVIHNFLTNSIKYRQPGIKPIIRIHSAIEKDAVVINYSDNGMGMDLSNGKDPFQLYTRFHSGVQGKGVGLFMVKKQVEQLSGTVTVESAVNKGTTFTMSLPR